MKRLFWIVCFLYMGWTVSAIDVSNEAELQACYTDLTEDYTLTANITITTNFSDFVMNPYSGTFEGDGYTIQDLEMTGSGGQSFMVLSSGGKLYNLTFDNAIITDAAVGSIIGHIFNNCIVSNVALLNSEITGNEAGFCFLARGGLLVDVVVSNCYFSNSDGDQIGYLVVRTTLAATPFIARHCRIYSTSNHVSSTGLYVGGLLGQLANNTAGDSFIFEECLVQDCLFRGSGSRGALMGYGSGWQPVNVERCIAINNTITGSAVGALIGTSYANPKAYNCAGYNNTLSGSTDQCLGARAYNGGSSYRYTISNCLAVGTLNGAGGKYGYQGAYNYDKGNSYFDNTVQAGCSDDAAHGQPTTNLQDQSWVGWSNWNFTDVWTWDATISDYPVLQWYSEFMTPAAASTTTWRRRVICN